jgi:hypothetical protein
VSALPQNSEPANSGTMVARAAGSTSVAQVCSDECIDAQARPSSAVAAIAAGTDREIDRVRHAATAAVAPRAISRCGWLRREIRPTTVANTRTAPP